MIIEIIGEGHKWFIENSYRQKSQKTLFQLQIKLLQQKNIKTMKIVHLKIKNIAKGTTDPGVDYFDQ